MVGVSVTGINYSSQRKMQHFTYRLSRASVRLLTWRLCLDHAALGAIHLDDKRGAFDRSMQHHLM